MVRVEEQTTIRAPPARVWSFLADLSTADRYVPGVVAVDLASEETEGLGAARVCRTHRGGWFEEAVAVWQPQTAIGFDVTRTKGVPLAGSQIRFTMEPEDGATTLKLSLTVRMGRSVLGRPLAFLGKPKLRTYARKVVGLVKQQVEAGR